MLKVVCSGLWDEVGAKAESAAMRHAAIAYVGNSPPIVFRSGDLLVVDASDESIKAGRTSAATLLAFHEAGAKLYSQPHLHAKIMVLDDWAVVGSANASAASASNHIEAAVITDRADAVAQVWRLIRDLATSGEEITASFLQRILALPVARGPFTPPTGRPPSPPTVHAPKTWLISVREDLQYPGEADLVNEVSEEEQARVGRTAGTMDWFFTRLSAYPDAQEGDIFIECVRPRNTVTSTRSVRVYPPATLRRIYQQPGVRSKTFHILRPRGTERLALSWSAFRELAKRAGVRRNITYRSNIAIRPRESAVLSELWPC